MKAALFYGGKDIRVEEVADPVPGPGEVLVRVEAAGICGSDLHDYRSAPVYARAHPFTSGHELAGTVVGLGPGVRGLQLADRVGVEPLHLIGCGTCRWCRAGHYEVCATRGLVNGVRRHSVGFAELDVAPEGSCTLLPEGLGFAEAAIVDVYACAVHAAQRVPALPTDSVVVIGTGPIGLATLEMYRALGAGQVLVCGVRDAALERARALGADAVINAARVDAAEAVRDRTAGQGAQVVIEAVGGRASTLAEALAMLAPNGVLGILGLYGEPQMLDPREAMRKQVRISWINSYALWQGVPEFRIAMDMMAARRFHPLQMITHRFPLTEIAAGFAAADDKRSSGAVKVIIEPGTQGAHAG